MPGLPIKVINSSLQKKFNSFVESITDPKVKNMVKENTIITGGCITSMLLGEKVNDYDLYFTNKETCVAVANYYIDKWNSKAGKHGKHPLGKSDIKVIWSEESSRVRIFISSSGVIGDLPVEDAEQPETTEESKEEEKYVPIYFSSNAITLSGKVQLVVRFYGDAKEIHRNYDFVHVTNYWTPSTGVVTNAKALESILARKLEYMGSLYPVCSVFRTKKFIQRGWSCNAGQYLKMAMQISKLDLDNIAVLEDQLIGVDTAYFLQIIDMLRKSAVNDMYDRSYLIKLIDEMF
ncbi:MAG TPA: hypothetical protein PL124_03970 [Candidatus Cloacimonadota bacterium]|nr:hypothetical protein [Candidatus Cloacimonadota bacterium]